MIDDGICEPALAAVLCSPQSAIQNPQLLNVPPIYVATCTSPDVDSCRLRCRAKSTTARSSDCGAGSTSCHSWCGLGKDSHPYLSRGLLARKRNRSSQYPASHVHKQSCARNAGTCSEFDAGRRQRTLGRHIPLHRKPDPAPARQRARLFERIHHHGPRRSKGLDRRSRNQRRN